MTITLRGSHSNQRMKNMATRIERVGDTFVYHVNEKPERPDDNENVTVLDEEQTRAVGPVTEQTMVEDSTQPLPTVNKEVLSDGSVVRAEVDQAQVDATKRRGPIGRAEKSVVDNERG